MTYKLRFHQLALKEWHKLDPTIREAFKKKLKERLIEPHILSSQLAGLSHCYKIKLSALGYRLVYQVDNLAVYVTVIAVGKREKNKVYKVAQTRLA